MARKEKDQKDPPRSQSIPGPTADNPNEDVADGNQAKIQPGAGSGNIVGGETSGDTSAVDGTSTTPGSQ